MFGISYIEAIVLLAVIALLFKPSDIIKIVSKLKTIIFNLQQFFTSLKQEFIKMSILSENFEVEENKKCKKNK